MFKKIPNFFRGKTLNGSSNNNNNNNSASSLFRRGKRSASRKEIDELFLLDDSTLRTFQKNALRLFDLPHHPRRLRQAALKWKAWREKVLIKTGLPSMLTKTAKTTETERGGGGDVEKRARTKMFLKNALIERKERRDKLKSIRGDGLMNLHDEMNPNQIGNGTVTDEEEEEEEERRLRALLLQEEELEEEEKKMQEKLSTEEAMALRQCSLCDALTDEQIVEILDASRTKSAFERGEDVSHESGFTKRGEEIAILCRGAFAIESMVMVTDDNDDAGEGRSVVSARTVVTKVGACVGSLVDVLDFSPPPLVGIREETSSKQSRPPSNSTLAGEGDIPRGSDSSSSNNRQSKNRLRAVTASDDAMFVVVPLNVFHDVMNQTVGAHALASRLVNAARCVCQYLSLESATKPLWVDEAGSERNDGKESNAIVAGERVKRGLERVLGPKKAQKVDRSAIATCLEELAERSGSSEIMERVITPLLVRKNEKKTSPESILPQQRGSGSSANRVGFVKRLFTSSSESFNSSKDATIDGKKSPASVNKKNGGGGSKGTPQEQTQAPPESSPKNENGEDENDKAARKENKDEQEKNEEAPMYEATMECRYYAPGQLVCALGSPGAAYFIECGVLEATFVKKNDLKNKNNSDVSWYANPGDVVQPFALLANTRSSIELRAGSSGAVVATLVSSEFHKLARYRDEIDAFVSISASVANATTNISIQGEKKTEDVEEEKTETVVKMQKNFSSVFTKIAADLAKRARRSLAGDALQYCGCEWDYVHVGERIRRLDDIASNGVMIVATGVCRVEAATYTKGAFAGVFSPRWTSIRSSSHDEHGNMSALKQRNNPVNDDKNASSSSLQGGNANSGSYSSAGSGDLLGALEHHNSSGGGTHQGHVAPIFSIPPRYVGPGEPCSEERVLFDDDEEEELEHAVERSRESIDNEYARQQHLQKLYRTNIYSGGDDFCASKKKKLFLLARAARDSQTLFVPGASLDNLTMRYPKKFLHFIKSVGARFANSQLLLASSFSLSNDGGTTNMMETPPRKMNPYDHHSDNNANELHPSSSLAALQSTSNHQRRGSRADKPKLVAVVPVSPGAALHLDAFVSSLMHALRRICSARVADSADHLAEVGSAAVGALSHEATAFWLHQLEETHDVVLLKGDPFPSAWCAQCASHADVVLLVASAEDEPPVPEEGKQLQQRLLGLRRHHQFNLGFRELVLLHEDANDSVPINTRPWLEAFGVHRHHHVGGKLGGNQGLHQAHAGRLARSLRKLSVGVVFSGGGARGCAHVGALIALEEEGIPIDAIGGTSMGAFIGGNYAREPSVLSTRVKAKRFAKTMSGFWNRISDLTLPIVSYFSGFRTNGAIASSFRDSKIEDCWLPFYCVTLDLISSRSIAHRNGTLWRYVRASMTLVGFLPPLCDKLDAPSSSKNANEDAERLHVLVDGGYANNVPVDMMKDLFGANTVIAVDVGGEGLESKKFENTWGDGVSGLSHVLRTLFTPKWLGIRSSCPTMAEMQAHLPFITDANNARRRDEDINVYIRPEVQCFGILEFSSVDAIERKGYEKTKAIIREWKLQQPELWQLIRRSCPDPAQGTKPHKSSFFPKGGSYDNVRSEFGKDESEDTSADHQQRNFDSDSRRGGGKSSVIAIFNSVKNNKKFLFGGRRSIEDVDEEFYDEYRRANNVSPDLMLKNRTLDGSGIGSPPKRYSGDFERIQRFNSVQIGQKPSMDLRGTSDSSSGGGGGGGGRNIPPSYPKRNSETKKKQSWSPEPVASRKMKTSFSLEFGSP